MAIQVIFETHSTSEDNETGHASGWNQSGLSERGRRQAIELGKRRSADGIGAIFVSDLRRAVETVEIAFAGTSVAILHDWRLRECDYGQLAGMRREMMHQDRLRYIRTRYPDGESWVEAIERVGWFIRDLLPRWAGCQVLVVGHIATRWGLEHHINGTSLEELLNEKFEWRAGWEFQINDT